MRPYREAYRMEPQMTKYEIARASLERIAKEDDSDRIPLQRLNGVLVDLGFKKKDLHNDNKSVAVYTRKNRSDLEVLADSTLLHKDDDTSSGGIHLYKIPAELDVEEWYGTINSSQEKFENYFDKIKTTGIVGSLAVGFTEVLNLSYSPDANLTKSALILGGYIGGCIGLSLLFTGLCNRLQRQTIVKGPDALRYIADNSIMKTNHLGEAV